MERAFHQREVGEVLRNAFGREDFADAGEIPAAAGEGGLEPLAQPPLVEVDAGEDGVVQLDLEVGGLAAQRLLGDAADLPAVQGVEAHVADVVDRGGLGLRLGEAVARGQDFELLHLDRLQRPAVGLGDGGARVGAAGRGQVDVDGAVPLLAGAFEVALAAFVHAAGEVRVSGGDEAGGALGGSEGCRLGCPVASGLAVGAAGGQHAQAHDHRPSARCSHPAPASPSPSLGRNARRILARTGCAGRRFRQGRG